MCYKPKTSAARRLVFLKDMLSKLPGSRCCRIVFDGSSAEPIIADGLDFRQVISCLQIPRILTAAFGQIVINRQ